MIRNTVPLAFLLVTCLAVFVASADTVDEAVCPSGKRA